MNCNELAIKTKSSVRARIGNWLRNTKAQSWSLDQEVSWTFKINLIDHDFIDHDINSIIVEHIELEDLDRVHHLHPFDFHYYWQLTFDRHLVLGAHHSTHTRPLHHV